MKNEFKNSGLKEPSCILAALMILSTLSCEKGLFPIKPQEGSIDLRFVEDHYIRTKASGSEIPDTNEFILTVTGAKGNVIFCGAYGNAPESITVGSGTYTVEVISHKFDKPGFDDPQYGDIQVVNVQEGKSTRVDLLCTQQNAAVRLNISPLFLTSYPKGVLFLKSSEGRLLYSYSEKRAAYFLPGSISLILSDDGVEQTLLTRTLSPKEMLHLNLTVSGAPSKEESGGGLSIQVDTSRYHKSEDYVLGGDGGRKGGEMDSALGISEARKHAGEKGVWVYGYIVGGDMTSSSASFETPFSSSTNLCIASKSSVRTKDSCMSVQLSKGDVRNALNLVDHPDYLHHILYVKGDIVESYFGIPGVQNISDWSLTN